MDSQESLLIASGKKIEFVDTEEYISSNGTDLSIVSGGDVDITSTKVAVVINITT